MPASQVQQLLLREVTRIVTESGGLEGFDAKKWLKIWLDEPVSALEGRKPKELLTTEDGRARVLQVLKAMQSGAYL